MRGKRAILALADGTIFEGWSVGVEAEAIGEVVFNTSITGYQEIITDPSYKGQIVTMTYPMIGNYGINKEDSESSRRYLEGLVIKECSSYPSNWRSQQNLDGFLKENGIVGIEGVDTRSLTRHIRDSGEQQGVIATSFLNYRELIEKARESPTLIGRDLVKGVTISEKYVWGKGIECFEKRDDIMEEERPFTAPFARNDREKNGRHRVVVIDCGVKFNILRRLKEWGCEAVVVPAFTSAEDILSLKPDGILFSNGPGDPSAPLYLIENARRLIGRKPIMGICLGHQILSLALGCKTYRLKFGHHGANQPVMDLKTKKVEITAQNHGFAVDQDSVPDRSASDYGRIEVSHINLNDRSVEGLACVDIPLFSVQYHPEASPGPHDANHMFERFTQMMEKCLK